MSNYICQNSNCILKMSGQHLCLCGNVILTIHTCCAGISSMYMLGKLTEFLKISKKKRIPSNSFQRHTGALSSKPTQGLFKCMFVSLGIYYSLGHRHLSYITWEIFFLVQMQMILSNNPKTYCFIDLEIISSVVCKLAISFQHSFFSDYKY